MDNKWKVIPIALVVLLPIALWKFTYTGEIGLVALVIGLLLFVGWVSEWFI